MDSMKADATGIRRNIIIRFMTHQKSETKSGLAPTSQFTRDGYALLQGSVPQQAIRDLYQTVVLLIRRYDSSLTEAEFQRLMAAPSWTDAGFHRRLIGLRADQPKMFGMIYDVVQLSTAMHRMCVEPELLAAVGHAWGVDPRSLAVTGHMLRMDPPHDTRNSLDWHQDSSYYEQNLAGENGMVVWIPMHHVDALNGSLFVCPGSHHEGQVEAVLSDPSDASMSRQRRVPQEVVDRHPAIQVVAEAGDALVMNMDTVHRSGVNSSDSLRFIAGYRYHKVLEDDFLPGKMRFHPNTSVGRLRDFRNQSDAVPAK